MPAKGSPPTQGVLYARIPYRVHAALLAIKEEYGVPMGTLAGVILSDALGMEHAQREAVRAILRDWKGQA